MNGDSPADVNVPAGDFVLAYRERKEIDLSKVKLTDQKLKNKGTQAMVLGEGETPKLPSITDIGPGLVQEKEKARLA